MQTKNLFVLIHIEIRVRLVPKTSLGLLWIIFVIYVFCTFFNSHEQTQ